MTNCLASMVEYGLKPIGEHVDISLSMRASSQARAFSSNLPIHHKGLVVISIPVIALLVSTCLFSYVQWKNDLAEKRVKHTLQVKGRIQTIVKAALDVQLSVRAYISSHDDRSFSAYRHACQAFPVLLTNLEVTVRDDESQSAHAKRIRSLTDDMLAHVDRMLPLIREKNTSSTEFQKLGMQTKALVDGWHRELDLIVADEDRLLELAIASSDAAKQRFKGALGLSIIFGIAGALLAVRLFTSGITRRLQVLEQNAARLQEGLTLLPLGQGSDEIGRLGTAIERASQLLAQRSERLRVALRTAKLAILEMDATGLIRYEGENEFIDSTGYAVDVLPRTRKGFFELLDLRDRAEVEQQFAQALAGKTEFRGEYRVNGSIQAERWISVAARHYSQEGGSPGVLGVLFDITERKQSEQITSRQATDLVKSEQMLREQTRILQCVLDSMGDAVAVAEKSGKFLLFNPAAKRILGMEAVETTPENRAQQCGIFLPDQITPCPASELPLTQAIRGINVNSEELFVRHAKLPEGAWVSCTARPLRDEAGVVWGGVSVFGEITERKNAERALRAAKEEAESANKAKSEFLSRMSHELRTPLNAIIGFAQVLEMTEVSERTRTRLGHILKAGRHLLGLIEEVMDISRIEARRLALSIEPVLVSQVTEQAIDLVRPIAANAGVRLEAAISKEPALYVSADRQRTQQILLNLLSNAIKYNAPGGLVTLSSGVVSDKVRIYVTDTGSGIAKNYLGKLFQPFERLGAVQTGVEGTGLGLALSKGLAEAMGGTIGVTSEVGQGSTFWLELSLVEGPKAVGGDVGLAALQSLHVDSSTVLYVEDNLSNVRLMEDIFAIRAGIKLVTAMQGQLGLDLAREHRPDLVFLDLHLPDLSGDQVLAGLRSDPRTRTIPVIMISADTTAGQVKRLRDAGAQDYLTKPIDVKKLLAVLDEYLSKRDENCVLHSVEKI